MAESFEWYKSVFASILRSDMEDYSNLYDTYQLLLNLRADYPFKENPDVRTYALEISKYAHEMADYMAAKTNSGDFNDLYYDLMLFEAPEVFESYLIYTEKDREPHERFYLPRKRCFDKIGIIREMQNLEEGQEQILCISLPPGSGKAQPLYSKILTPDGFVKMGDIKEGQTVISGNGNECKVIGVFPQGKKSVYELTFNDGSKCRCSDEHLWRVQTRDDRVRGDKYRVIPLSDMMKNLRVENDKRLNYSIDYVGKIDCPDKEFYLHPYVLGALLGDGGLSGGAAIISTPDKEILDKMRLLLPEGMTLNRVDDLSFRLAEGYSVRDNGRFTKCPLRKELESLGLWGKKSKEKFIPEEYKYASYEQRLELLRGLLDTDGCASKSVEYSSSSPQLAQDVVDLVHSLGGYASIKKHYSKYTYKGEKKDGLPNYKVMIEFPKDSPDIFYLPRKNDAYNPKRAILKRYLKDVQYVGEEECQCIMVDDPSHLYVTDDYIVTHNTTLGEFFMSWVMGRHPEDYNLMSSHSGYVTEMFHKAIKNIIMSTEYRWAEVFPHVTVERVNEKESTINLGKYKPFASLTCRAIGASQTGVTRCSGYLYCDDLISGLEEALSADRLEKKYQMYATDLKTRKKLGCKEIHIANRTSVNDVIGHLERQYQADTQVKMIAVPDIDPETGKSNFNYDYGVGFDEKYFLEMQESLDDVTYQCMFKNQPIEREGLLYHDEDFERYFDLPADRKPDSILGVCDTKDAGTDYCFLPIMYQYGDKYYFEDCVYDNGKIETCDALCADMIIKHNPHNVQFESNAAGGRTADAVNELIKGKARTTITKKYTTQNKETKIIVNSGWIKEHVVLRDKSTYTASSPYGKAIAALFAYSEVGKNQCDHVPDGLAMFAEYVSKPEARKTRVVSSPI